jgi:hypothetical protein
MRLYWWLRAKFKAWNYKRKYGVPIDQGIREYGKYIKLTEEDK